MHGFHNLISERFLNEHNFIPLKRQRRRQMNDKRGTNALWTAAVVAFAVHHAGGFAVKPLRVARCGNIPRALNGSFQRGRKLVDAADHKAGFCAV